MDDELMRLYRVLPSQKDMLAYFLSVFLKNLKFEFKKIHLLKAES